MNMIPRMKSMRRKMMRIGTMRMMGIVRKRKKNMRIVCRFSDTRNWPRQAQGVKRTPSMTNLVHPNFF